jgi:nucleotide-binding universal stress UspA family protein
MLKDIMVHLDGGKDDEIRLVHAEALALLCEARLVGLYTNPLIEYAFVLAVQSGLAPMEPIIEAEERMRKNGDEAVRKLERRLAQSPVSSVIHRLDVGMSQLARLGAAEARWADLFVASTPYQADKPLFWDDLIESITFEAGHGVYLIPPGAKSPPKLEKVLIAWHGTREATRAIAEALPLLSSAKVVRLAIIDPSDDGTCETPRVIEYFKRRGIVIETTVLNSEKKPVSDILLREARSINADLIVMGAYGHSRLREWIFGGTTRGMLMNSDVPLLVAH